MIVLHHSRGNENGPQLKCEGEANVHEMIEGSYDVSSDQDVLILNCIQRKLDKEAEDFQDESFECHEKYKKK